MPEFLRVPEILHHLDLKPDMVAAEFGCGSAVFSLELAKQLANGKVYGLDIQEEKLSALQGKAHVQHIANIQTIHCDLEANNGSTLPANSLDVVLIPNVLFQAENRRAIMAEAQRILKSKGQLLVIDWLKATPFSPTTNLVKPEEVKQIAATLHLAFKKEFGAGDYHYALIFEKS